MTSNQHPHCRQNSLSSYASAYSADIESFLEDLGASPQLPLRPLVIVATTSPEIHVLTKATSYGKHREPICSASTLSSDSTTPDSSSDTERKQNGCKDAGWLSVSFPKNMLDSSDSSGSDDGDDKKNLLPRRWISQRTKYDLRPVNESCRSKHRRISYDRLPRLEEIGKALLPPAIVSKQEACN
eukprot:scaffold9308_cov115-Cylindrotheca_fusiformis.AAC.16